MPRSIALLAGASLLLAAPLAAQTGLASVPRSVTLSATRLPSVALRLPEEVATGRPASLVVASTRVGSLPLTTMWNVNPAEPVAITLVAFLDESYAPLFTQPIVAPNQRGGRIDEVPVGAAGTLTLVAITQ